MQFNGGDGTDTARSNGTNGDDKIGIANAGTVGRRLRARPEPARRIRRREKLVVNGLGGNDTIIGQNGIATLTRLTIDGGAGNDTIAGGDGDDMLHRRRRQRPRRRQPRQRHRLLGAGDDTFQWDPGDGNDTVEGQAAATRCSSTAPTSARRSTVSANGPRVRLTRDVAAITMDLDGDRDVNVRTLGGADTSPSTTSRAPTSSAVNVDLAPSTAPATARPTT